MDLTEDLPISRIALSMAPPAIMGNHALFLAETSAKIYRPNDNLNMDLEEKSITKKQIDNGKVSKKQQSEIEKNLENVKRTENSKQENLIKTTQKEDVLPKLKWHIVWPNVIKISILHIFMFYAFIMMITLRVKLATVIFSYIYIMWAGFGITAGAHRLWCHRAYKANVPLRIFLMLAQSAALQNDIYIWVRDHRVHHKFTDTNADPHNAKRGFFYSHMGWLMLRKHRDVLEKGKAIYMQDVADDPVVKFQRKYYVPLIITFCFVIPAFIPWYFWNEDGWVSFVFAVAKYTVGLNGTWLVNSAAHIYGMRPFDKTILPTENWFVSALAFGEGWHNYHHIFPWDYKAAELGNYRLNFTTCFLDFMSKIGWATELKTASADIIKKRVLRTGDGTYHSLENVIKELGTNEKYSQHEENENLWGWGDKDMKEDEKKMVESFNNIKTST